MKLETVRVQLFRNVVDSNSVKIEPEVTCLVGKNESGKTAFLWALANLNPAKGEKTDLTLDYPRWRKVRDERSGNISQVNFVECVFSPTDVELKTLTAQAGIPLPASSQIVANKNYKGELITGLIIQENDMVQALSIQAPFVCDDCITLEELRLRALAELDNLSKNTNAYKKIEAYISLLDIAKNILSGTVSQEISNQIIEFIPKFFYFSEYNLLKGRIDLNALLSRPKESLDEYDRTALSLLSFVDVQGKEFTLENFEERTAELEAAANEVTRQIFDYWTQNKDLSVSLTSDAQTVPVQNGQTAVHKYLDIRLRDHRHGNMTTNFETRSAGFRWFFSFIVAFTEFEKEKNLIVLLDEPGMGLHAKAQNNLLDYVENRLGKSTQVLFTTHSPFMVNPKRLECVRLVEDLSTQENPDVGCKIYDDIHAVKGDTRFPLQAALGYDLGQNLFIGGYNLIVEGIADYIYLDLFSLYFEQNQRTLLNSKFIITPVGGIDKIPTFIALLGNKLDCTVLVDGQVSTNQKLQDMISGGLLSTDKLITITQLVNKRGASIEDLFSLSEYIELYNKTFDTHFLVSEFNEHEAHTTQIERKIGRKFDHRLPANYLFRNRSQIEALSAETKQRFEDLFQLLNSAIESNR